MTQQEERKKKTIAALSTLGINFIVFLILIFAAAWRTPGPPADEYGIEVNLGYDDVGSGDIQPLKQIGTPEVNDTENPPAQPVEEEEVKQISAPPEVQPDDKPAEKVTATDPTSDVEIKEEKKDVAPKEKPVVKPVEKEIDKKPVEKKVEEKPVVDTKAVYKGKTSSTPVTPGTGEGKEGEAGNHGDDKGKVGDKGNPDGSLDAKALYGKPGGGDGGDGPSLDLYGWQWDNIPKPNTPDNETSGRIVYIIEVDENGDLIKYRKESGSVSAAAERACIESLQKLTFTKKSGAKVPSISKGRITFVIRSQ